MGMIHYVSEKEVKEQHPEEYTRLYNMMKKKKRNLNNLTWYYDEFINLTELDITEKIEDIIEDMKSSNFLIYLVVSEKKSKSQETLSKFPQLLIDEAIKNYNKKVSHEKKEIEFSKNMQEVISKLNLKDSDLDRFGYPKFEHIKEAFPDVYRKYQSLSNGNVLIKFYPRHKEKDEWGFCSYNIILATKRLEEDGVRFIYDDIVTGSYITLHGDEGASNRGYLKMIEKAFSVKDGENFIGWNRTKQYRLTRDEISNIIKGRVFDDVDLHF